MNLSFLRKSVVAALVFGAVAIGWAQPRRTPTVRPLPAPRIAQGAPGPRAAKTLERLSNMSPEQRQRVLEKLPPERRERIQRQLDSYSKLTAEERDRLHRQVDAFQQLPPERQDAVRKAFRHFNNMDPGRRSLVQGELQSLRKMSPEERQARLDSDEFRGRFKRGEQKLIEQLSDVPIE